MEGGSGNDRGNGDDDHTMADGEGDDRVQGTSGGGRTSPVVIGELSGVTVLKDLRFSTWNGGVVISLGSHGSIYLQGELSVSAVARARNFEFLAV